MPTLGDLLQCVLGLMATVALTVALLYLLHNDLYRELRHLCDRNGTTAMAAPGEAPAAADADAGASAAQEPPPIPTETADVREYTPPGSSRVRILHPQTAAALARLREEAKTDANLLTQVTVTSSAQYPGVTADLPLLVNTYKRDI